ncbi:S41 family peptidase [Pseudobacteriovorax antillogorgiicola]|uniref:C-terminal peptidase (Prc) n=1 Tax=Pseudobacteriovorax antillogorgiicola TaxID=1513793 RepID=A0A1Y6B3P1_9BACT|nr:S41 family peptidase [Pseudobacteriovorax antillogorgiicola]TCS59515.1 C-terminal peptidase prc [Pseudobacteriovorax antillogorgiicola]SME87873.1 C-terminal peptidase (prc) [Pseudobacteriovorax antillogorgiicola]
MKLVAKIATLLTGVLLGVLVSLISTKVLEHHLLDKQMKLSALGTEPLSGLKQPSDADFSQDRIANAILVDSILTIIQNYYVDPDRALDNQSLIEGALLELNHYREVSVSDVDEGHRRVQIGKMVTEFSLESDYTFQRLLEDSIHLASFIGKSDLAKNEMFASSQSSNIGAFIYLNALLHSLDPHSGLLDQEEYRELKQGTEGSFGGLGVVVGIQNDVLTVIKPLPHSPAEKAGINGRDQITFINDKSTFGTSLQNLVHHMRGAPGTEVHLSLLRAGENAPRKIKIRREVIQVDSINAEVLKAGDYPVLYLTVDSFSSRTSEEIKEAISFYSREQGIKGITLDLRGNPGGLLDQAVKAADLFLHRGRIVSTSGRRPEVEVAYDDKDEFDLPVVILVDGETASASEILAGALQDNNRAIVIGQPTFGKGSVQTVFELPSNQALKLTIARYYSPSGKTIQNMGIMPDVWVQPIFAADRNLNLLGPGRYASERFLANTLSGAGYQEVPTPRYKFFYQRQSISGDYEKQLALGVFHELFAKNEVPLTEEKQRATYWLASASGYVNQENRVREDEVERYLQTKHRVNWVDTRHPVVEPLAIVTKLKSDSLVSVLEGRPLTVEWEVSNLGDHAVDRVSVFLRSENLEIPTQEQLLGTLKSGQTIRGEMILDLELPANPSPYSLFLGSSIEGWPVMKQQKELRVLVKTSHKPQLSFDISLVDEQGGHEDGILEPGEKAILEVSLLNESDIEAHDVKASLANLSGKQVEIPEKVSETIQTLGTGKNVVVRFPISVSEELISNDLHFGLTIDAEEYLVPLKRDHLLKAIPKRR